ncbi:protein-disulfide reductase DsbD N-terminal domain-containing protein, partial [Methylobacterium hispanicum]
MPNVFTHLILAALLWTGSSLWSPGQCREPGARPTPFTVDAARDPDLSLRLRWTIAPGTYLYRDKIAATDASGRELPVSTQLGETKDDPNFGPTEVYHGATEAIVPGAALAGVREVRVTYQGCAEKGICYPPINKVIEVPALGPQATATAATPATDAQAEP